MRDVHLTRRVRAPGGAVLGVEGEVTGGAVGARGGTVARGVQDWRGGGGTP